MIKGGEVGVTVGSKSGFEMGVAGVEQAVDNTMKR
jgi:hypothetical protein